MTRRIRALLVALAVAASGFAALAPAAFARQADTYQVTITNLTSGQPLTPPVAATHRGKNAIFRVGRTASFELKEIAENGNNGPLLTALDDDRQVAAVAEGPGGPLVPAGRPGSGSFDDTTTFPLTADRGANRVSFASMLICTNDGFTGVNSLRLPKRIGDSVTATTAGYDAGTEVNTEDFVDIVPPCQSLIGVTSADAGTATSNPALAQGGVIRHHPGIVGGVDLLPGVHGWTDPVARITVTATG
jgi:hypothetical protein